MNENGTDDTRSKLMSQHNRIMKNAMAKDEEVATYPLPICDVNNTLHTLIGLFPLATLKRLSKGLADAVAVIEGCGGPDKFQLSSQPAAQRSQPSSNHVHRSRLSPEERADIVARRARGEKLQPIADAVGRSVATVSAVLAKARSGGGE